MGLADKSWWKKVVGAKEQHPKVSLLEEIDAIRDFLEDVNADLTSLKSQLLKLEELEKERQMITRENLLLVNLETQAELLDKLLQQYQFFQEDADINGLRVKKIAKEFLKAAEKAGLTDLVKEKRQDLKWRFDW